MKNSTKRRSAALALTAAATLGAGLLATGPAAAISRVGGIGCSTKGVTLFEGYGNSSVACYAGTAGTYRDGNPGIGSVMGVWNHGYAQYTMPGNVDDLTGFSANGVHYRYDNQDCDNYSVTILN